MKRLVSQIWTLAALTASAQSPSMAPTPLQPAPQDSAQLQLRQARGALFDNLFGVTGDQVAPPIEARDAPPVMTSHQLGDMGELPGAFADTILIGLVVNSQAFQSNNHTAIYTEATVAVQQVFSQQGAYAVAGGSIVFVQIGGSITLPGGRVLTHISMGLGNQFQQGERYAFFLTYVSKAQCYKLTKAWLLQGGEVVAVAADDLARVHNGTSQVNGIPETTLITILKSLQASYKVQ